MKVADLALIFRNAETYDQLPTPDPALYLVADGVRTGDAASPTQLVGDAGNREQTGLEDRILNVLAID